MSRASTFSVIRASCRAQNVIFLILLCLSGFLEGCTTVSSRMPAGQHALGEALAPILAPSQAQGARWGILVTDRAGKVVFSLNAHQRFIPASNTKLFTTAAAFSVLAALQHDPATHETIVALVRRPHGAPDLVLRGAGDPALSDQVSCQRDCLAKLADGVVAARVRRVHAIIGDDRIFTDERWGEGWSWNNLQAPWGTAVSGLSLNDNVASLDVAPSGNPGAPPSTRWENQSDGLSLLNDAETVAQGMSSLKIEKRSGEQRVRLYGAVPVGAPSETLSVGLDDPAATAAAHLKVLLLKRGIMVQISRAEHRPLQKSWISPPAAEQVLARLPAADLEENIRHLLKVSQNLHAELLLRRLGRIQGDGSVAQGVLERQHLLAAGGLDPASFTLVDGSGMSSYNRVTPSAVVALLRWVDRQSWGARWRAGLPVAAENGTLSTRFKDTMLAGRLQAKTGTIEATRALSGYLQAASGRTLCFSVLVNDVPEEIVRPTDIMDRALLTIAALE